MAFIRHRAGWTIIALGLLAGCHQTPPREAASQAFFTWDKQAWLEAAERWTRETPEEQVSLDLKRGLARAFWQAGDKGKALVWWRSAAQNLGKDSHWDWMDLAREMDVSVEEVRRLGKEDLLEWSDAARSIQRGDWPGAERVMARLLKEGKPERPSNGLEQAWGRNLRAAGRWQDAFNGRREDEGFWPAWESAGAAAPDWATLERWMAEAGFFPDARDFDMLLRKGCFDLAWRLRNDVLAGAALKGGHHAWFLEKMRAQGEGLRSFLELHAQAVVCQRPEACQVIAREVEAALPAAEINRDFPWGDHLRYLHDRGESFGLAWPALRAELAACLAGEEGVKSAAGWLRSQVVDPLPAETAIRVLSVLLKDHPRRRELLVAVCMVDYQDEYPFTSPGSDLGNALRAWVRRELAHPPAGAPDGREVWEGRIALAARDEDWKEVVEIVAGLPVGFRQEQAEGWAWKLSWCCHEGGEGGPWDALTALLALASDPGAVNLSPGWIDEGSGGHLTLAEAQWFERHWLPHVKDTTKRRKVVLRMACGLRAEVGLMCATGMGRYEPPKKHPAEANQLLAKEAAAAFKAGDEESWLALLAAIRLADGGGAAQGVKDSVRQWCAQDKVEVGAELSEAQWSVREKVITFALAADWPEYALAADRKYPGACRPKQYPCDGHPIWWLGGALTDGDGPPGCSPVSAWWILQDWWDKETAAARGLPTEGSAAEGVRYLFLPALQTFKDAGYFSNFSSWPAMESALLVPAGKRSRVVAELRRLAAAPLPAGVEVDEERMASVRTNLQEAIAVLRALDGDIEPAKALWCQEPEVGVNDRATFFSRDVSAAENLLFILYKRNSEAAKAWMAVCARDGDGGLPEGDWTDGNGRIVPWDYLALARLLPEGTRADVRAEVALRCHVQLREQAEGRR